MLFLGIDLAWAEGCAKRLANETGLAALTTSGAVVDADWRRGLDETVAWVAETAA